MNRLAAAQPRDDHVKPPKGLMFVFVVSVVMVNMKLFAYFHCRELVKSAVSHVRRGFNLLISVLWNNGEEVVRLSKCKESPGPIRFTQNKKIRTAETTAYERV